jgi:hypothetical protein
MPAFSKEQKSRLRKWSDGKRRTVLLIQSRLGDAQFEQAGLKEHLKQHMYELKCVTYLHNGDFVKAKTYFTKWRHAALDSLEEVMDSKAVDGGFEFKVQRVGGTVESVRGHSEATRQLAKNIQEKHEALSQFF